MKYIFTILFVLIIFGANGYGATRSDIYIIEASENIRHLSQKIAKYYLYLYSNPKQLEVKDQLIDMVKETERNFQTIISSTDKQETKKILAKLQKTNRDIETLLQKNIDKKNAYKMLDYSEVLLEGADQIVKRHSYPFNNEEAMFMHIKRYEYLVERLGKFYMATTLGAFSQDNRSKFNNSKKSLENGLRSIMNYHYPKSLEKNKDQLKTFWEVNKHIFAHAYDTFVPNLMIISGQRLESLLSDYELYHRKKQ